MVLLNRTWLTTGFFDDLHSAKWNQRTCDYNTVTIIQSHFSVMSWPEHLDAHNQLWYWKEECAATDLVFRALRKPSDNHCRRCNGSDIVVIQLF